MKLFSKKIASNVHFLHCNLNFNSLFLRRSKDKDKDYFENVKTNIDKN